MFSAILIISGFYLLFTTLKLYKTISKKTKHKLSVEPVFENLKHGNVDRNSYGDRLSVIIDPKSKKYKTITKKSFNPLGDNWIS